MALSAPQALGRVNPSVEVVVTSATMSQALTRVPDTHFGPRPASGVPVIHVNDAVRYQRVNGVGAAMSDSSAWLIHDQLGPAARSSLMNALFGSSGLGLNFIRVPMGATDFTAARLPYTYDDLRRGRRDPKLEHFSVAHDRPYIIPLLRQALALNPRTTVLANPWSPPAWMKANGRLDNRAHSGRLRSFAYAPLASYFVRFIQAYARAGIHVGAITPQNEPGNPTLYPGMEFSEPAEAGWIVDYLRPALRAAGLRPQIYGYDYGWSRASAGFGDRLARSRAAASLTGIASHCYFGSPGLISSLHRMNPRLDEIVSECSPGITPFATSELLISSIRNWASTVALWNLALDREGGPVQPPNEGCPHCTGVVTVDPATHTFVPTLDYFQLGQFSRFVRPGAVRIASDHFVRYRYVKRGADIATPGLDDVAFLNPNGSKVLLTYNDSTVTQVFSVESRGRTFTAQLPPGMSGTFIWDRPR
jgi:glucosylceramidase